MQSKLTLRMDEEVIRRAKAYAEAHGTSVSTLVARYLRLLESGVSSNAEITPAVQRLKGLLRGIEIEASDYRSHQETKHR